MIKKCSRRSRVWSRNWIYGSAEPEPKEMFLAPQQLSCHIWYFFFFLREGLRVKLPAFLGASTPLFESGSIQNPDLKHRYRVLFQCVSQFAFAHSTNSIFLIRGP
jgi:hypothetical protein